MSSEVKRYDPINSDGTCGMCAEDADYGAYVEYADYAALEAERNELQRRLDAADEWATLASEQLKERDALAAELQALKAPCSEVPEVVGYRHRSASSAGFAVVTHHGVPPVIPLAKWHDPDGLMTIAQHERIVAAMADELEQVRTALGGMLFTFDDGVGRGWSKTLLDFARKLASAKEYKS